MHDIVFRGATLIDGTGAPVRRGDLAVADGRIVALGEVDGPSRATIDADGLALMPGIIDGHTHYDAQLTWDPWADPSPALGVTTVVIGNCGFAIAPCRPADRDITMRNLTQVEGMSLAALRTGIRWEFETFPEYLAMLERNGVVPNVVAFAGHSSIRTWVMGADASTRAANDDEIARMADLVREAIAAGAVGLGSSTNEPHNGEGGVPMPSRLADAREFRALLAAMRDAGRGVFMLTKGSTTTVPFLEELAADSGRSVIVAAMFHSNTAPTRVFEQVEEMKAAQARGRRVIPQVSCCALTMEFTLRSAYVFEDNATWKQAMRTPQDALPRLYSDVAFREGFKADLEAGVGRRLFNSEWHRLFLRAAKAPRHRALEGRSIAELAAAARKHPVDWMLDFALGEDLDTLFVAELLNSDPDAVGRLINEDSAHVSLSDAGAHLTFLCDADFGLNLLGHWSRERGALPLEKAVWKLTGHPATLFGLRDRGILRAGAAADLLLFDPAQVGRGQRRRAFDLPAGASRLVADGQGIHGVWVNGVQVVDAQGPIDAVARPGRILRDFAPV
ncbi:MAG: N-acyl-D-amino-acid deacylase family protein [Rhodospirillales bacterium]|jgi:N-acyl-D-aspartate/D-glutamate deacylase